MRQPIVAANWKLNGSHTMVQSLGQEVLNACGQYEGVSVVLCPPSVYLDSLAGILKESPIHWGGQNVSEHASGAFTGEISAEMLADCGCRYVIIGHSERRALYGETDAQIAQKFVMAQEQGLTPILCLGETLEQRELGSTQQIVLGQLRAVLDHAGVENFDNAVVAYEPVWAIGTGKTASSAQAQEVHAFIREEITSHDAKIASQLRILYGGSVKPDNAAELFANEDIDGGLIGGASLKIDQFLPIVQAAA